ncbi:MULTISPECIES: GNAT family N-acetyltransferase [Glycomyces]|uniref:GNAT family N-acetyltransferase n=2 Tax=Glycomyces TaxID=58113 RepID=A0A9X3PGS2_9ACTN|nr:GNAT family N-acetyltransferase [Glycomyces lechevalierae]MDA1383869.1 GNAT family N-acetyltransferase [Glycomyces lechevalierae]MDR7341140.1 putative N-acetyltransferase YhbS [Glycomyces lechevalierae]
MRIRPAVTADFPLLQDLERAAGECFRGIGMPEIADDEPFSFTELARHQRMGLAWVAAEEDLPVAYLLAEPVDAALHIEQVSVHPDFAHRRIGRALIEHAAARAAADGLDSLTLTTFTEVPWNAPYYARCGFTPIAPGDLTPGLREVREQEAAHGLDRWPRVCMRRPL